MRTANPRTASGSANSTEKIIPSLATQMQTCALIERSMTGPWISPARKVEILLSLVALLWPPMARAALLLRVEQPELGRRLAALGREAIFYPNRRWPRSSRTSRSSTSSKRTRSSAAGFCLRDVTLDLLDVGANNGADEAAAAIVNVDLRNRADVVLLHHRRFPVDDVDLAQRNLRIGSCHLLQAWRDVFARAAPVRIKIYDGHVAECEMFADVHRRAVRDHFHLLTATRDNRSRRSNLILLVFCWFLSGPISVLFFNEFPS